MALRDFLKNEPAPTGLESANVFAGYMGPPRSALEYEQEFRSNAQNAAIARTNALELAAQNRALQEQQRALDVQSRLPAGTSLQERLDALYNAGLSTQAEALQKTQADTRLVQGQADVQKAASEATQLKTRRETLDDFNVRLHGAVQPADAHALIDEAIRRGVLSQESAAALRSTVPVDASGMTSFRTDVSRRIITAKEQLPVPVHYDAGDSLVFGTLDPLTGQITISRTVVTKGMSPDQVGVIKAQYGILPGSGAGAAQTQQGSQERTASAPYGTGKYGAEIDALIPRIAANEMDIGKASKGIPQVEQYLNDEARKLNPKWTPVGYAVRNKAIEDVMTGETGTTLRKTANVREHIEKLGELSEALNSGSVQRVNQLFNWFGREAGADPQAAYSALMGVVGKEFNAALVPGGGGVGEREEAVGMFDPKLSPQQFLAVKNALTDALDTQFNNLRQQKLEAGVPESLFPRYGGAHTRQTAAAAGPGEERGSKVPPKPAAGAAGASQAGSKPASAPQPRPQPQPKVIDFRNLKG